MKMPLPPVSSSDTSAAGPAGRSRAVAVGVDVGLDVGSGVSVSRGVAVALAVGVSDGVEVTVAVAVSVAVFPAVGSSEHAETSRANSAPCTTRSAALQCTLFALLDGRRSTLMSFQRIFMCTPFLNVVYHVFRTAFGRRAGACVVGSRATRDE